MSNWDEIIANSKEFPNDTTVKLANGTEISLGTIRSGYLKDKDYREKTTALARQKDELERQWTERVQALQEAEAHLMGLARDIVQNKPAGVPRQEIQEDVAADPEVRRLATQIDEMKKVMEPMARALVDMDKRWQEAQKASLVTAHRETLAKLKEKDPDLDETALISWAKEHYVPRLDVAYTAMKHDELLKREVERAKTTAFEEGKKTGREEALMPPTLPTQGAGIPAGDSPRPKNIDDAFEMAKRDPEILSILMGRT
jgi:hypothetical protein